jgi:hypothetical protein
MSERHISRRGLLAAAAALAGSAGLRAAAGGLPPVRAITRGPKFHWFGYYDKLQFDPAGRLVLGMEVDFEHRSPRGEDVIRVGVIDTGDGDRWRELGTSRAWGWQQGCMLQWRPGSKTEVLWNDRDGDRHVCHVLDTTGGTKRTIPTPVYALAPDGRSAVTVDFRRLNEARPGYGYSGLPDPHRDELTPKDAGVWRVDLGTGERTLIFSHADAATFGKQLPDADGAKHWFNHLLYNPSGSRFVFLHRWRPKGQKTAFRTRMLTAAPDGKDRRVIDPSGATSHFIWRDDGHILAWTQPLGRPSGFYLFGDEDGSVEPVGPGVMTVNGHCTYLPGNRWVLNDTYPDKERLQHPYLYELATGRRVPLGHFMSPAAYTGEWRCDTHPRFSPDGTKVVIDSPHGGGRQMYLIDVAAIVGRG